MARKEVVQYIDDLSGENLDKNEVRIVEFGYKGSNYVIDLSEANAAKFDEVMRRWTDAGHRVSRSSSAFKPKKQRRSDLPLIRKWADENGYQVSSRGQIAKDVIAAYDNR